jgi:dihydropteroate synthase-like protein
MTKILFITGKLAAQALEDILRAMEPEFDYELAVMNISVAAFMTVDWIARRLNVTADYDLVMVPGYCRGDLSAIEALTAAKAVRGPKDLKDIPFYFGQQRISADYSEYHEYQTKILAEIVDAPLLSLEEILAQAEYYRASGADIIDLGWQANSDFPEVGQTVAALKERGFIVSLDTFNRKDVLQAKRVGFDYLLSINSHNLDLARELSCRVVVIPDPGGGLDSLERNIAQLEAWGIEYIIDPIIQPINFGFVESILRYRQVRERHPDAEILMGIANISELIDADSTGINALMMGIVTELNINYVLITEVISWAHGAVREVNIGRKLMGYAQHNHILPKHIDERLITVKDPPHILYTEGELRAMQAKVKDRNFRIFTDDKAIYVFNNQLFIKQTDSDIQHIFEQIGVKDAGHAFYIGKELQKATQAVRLGKKYVQDEPLRWGYLSSDT